jgi:hypothetical protein
MFVIQKKLLKFNFFFHVHFHVKYSYTPFCMLKYYITKYSLRIPYQKKYSLTTRLGLNLMVRRLSNHNILMFNPLLY